MTPDFDDVAGFERELANPESTDPRVLAARRIEAAAATVPPVRHSLLAEARIRAEASPVARPHLRHRGLVAAAVMLVASTGVAAAASSAQPGDTLWGVRRVGQVVRVAVTPGEDAKARLLLDQAEGALKTAKTLEERGRVDEARLAVNLADERLEHAREVTSRARERQRERLEERTERLERDSRDQEKSVDDRDDSDDRDDGGDGDEPRSEDSGKGSSDSGSSGKDSSDSGNSGEGSDSDDD